MTDLETSGEDGDIGRYTLPPHTTKRRTTTNLKTKNNQNCQKIELYGSLTTKELKRKHLSRLAGGAEMDSQGGEDVRWWLADQPVSHLRADKLGETTGERNKPHNPGFWHRKRKPQNLWL